MGGLPQERNELPLFLNQNTYHAKRGKKKMNGQVVFHVGLPKCGTTWLQKSVFPYLLGANYLGRNYKTLSGDAFSKPKLMRDNVNSKLENIAKSHEFVYEKPSFGELSPNKVNLLSSEMLSEVFNFERSALRIKGMFPDAKVIVSVREQKSLITSIYLNEVWKGQTKKLSEILNDSNVNGQRIIGKPEIWLPHFLYYEMLCFYKSLFGSNVLVLPIEMAGEGRIFFDMLDGFLFGETHEDAAHRLKYDDAITNKKDNTGKVDPRALILWRWYNKMTRERNKRRGEAVALNYLGRLVVGAGKKALAGQIKEVGRYYAKSNRALGAAISVDMERYGYDISDAGAQ